MAITGLGSTVTVIIENPSERATMAFLDRMKNMYSRPLKVSFSKEEIRFTAPLSQASKILEDIR